MWSAFFVSSKLTKILDIFTNLFERLITKSNVVYSLELRISKRNLINLLVSIGWKIGLEEINAWSWYPMWYTVRTERKKRNLMNLLVSRGWKMDLRRWLLDHEIQCGILLRIENIEKKFNEFASLQRMENGLEEMNAWSHDSQH